MSEEVKYVIAPNYEQARYWLEQAGISYKGVTYLRSPAEQLRGMRGVTVYEVGSGMTGLQWAEMEYLQNARGVKLVMGLPGLPESRPY